jgi:type IV pilus biogenesis/stability protein PilW
MKKLFKFKYSTFVPGYRLGPGVPLAALLCILVLYACASVQQSEDKRKAKLLYEIGVSYLENDQLQKAFVKFHEALQLNPKDKYTLNSLGYISARFQEYDSAISYYKRAIAIDPEYSDAMNNLGVTYIETGKLDEAVKYFNMALQNPLYPTPEKAYSNLGFALYKKGEYGAAEDTLKTAIIKYPEYFYSAYRLGLVYSELGKMDKAIGMFDRAVKKAPYYIDARWELAHAYLREGENEKALVHFQIIAESNNDNKRIKEALKYIELLREP